MGYVEDVKEAVKFVESKIEKVPKVAIVLGSGLSVIKDAVEVSLKIKYSDIPHFPISTAPGHAGEMIFGKWNGVDVVLMNGRFHYYEGYSMKEVTMPIRVFQLLGIQYLFLTNAAGGLNHSFEPGHPMIITDHINFMGDNPLIGKNVDEWGVRFPDMSHAYNPELISLAEETCKELALEYYKGIYIAFTGPNFETPAELKMARYFGADAVGMSTVPEVIVANHGGLKVLAISSITDRAIPEGLEPLTAEEVIEVAEKTGKKIATIFENVLTKLERK
ncbi:purine-nucleoside phosphorylase [Mesoaciditoga lauensis]|uniref:purine-nucleoside phosphorylase n=1 Tax=Mesoaciditoga lauensis TaxID=1495039 RepID=UPI000563703B|nr:purine-nucleoside phosphorylase [Mesoaciditoga lauensis]